MAAMLMLMKENKLCRMSILALVQTFCGLDYNGCRHNWRNIAISLTIGFFGPPGCWGVSGAR